MITYESCCKKIGFDPLVEYVDLYEDVPDYEDDSWEDPLRKMLTPEERSFFTQYLIAHHDELDASIARYEASKK